VCAEHHGTILGILEDAQGQDALFGRALQQHELPDVVQEAHEKVVVGFDPQGLRDEARGDPGGERAAPQRLGVRLEARHGRRDAVRHDDEQRVPRRLEAEVHDGLAHARDRLARREQPGRGQ
jgi:hypothetical protein